MSIANQISGMILGGMVQAFGSIAGASLTTIPTVGSLAGQAHLMPMLNLIRIAFSLGPAIEAGAAMIAAPGHPVFPVSGLQITIES